MSTIYYVGEEVL